MKEVTCRHCGEVFSPMPGKPGYIDECLECLFTKSAHLNPKALSRLADEAERKMEQELRKLRTKFVGKDVSKEKDVDEFVALLRQEIKRCGRGPN